MSSSYESDKGRDLDDIDFQEFLTKDGELAEKPRQQKPRNEKGTSRRLIATFDERRRTNSLQTGRVSEDRDDDNQTNTDQANRDGAGTYEAISGATGAEATSTDALAKDENQDDAHDRTAERMSWSTRQKLVVAFQGEAGAYSEQALHDYFGPDAVSLPCSDFRGIFDTIHSGKSQRGILPVENSLAGTVSAAYDQLVDTDLRIQAEVILRVEHCLMAPAGLKMQDIKRVKSHPHALAQCKQTLRRLGLEPVAHYDTAGAARDLAAKPEPATAAIASALAAKTYGLDILSRHFEDEPLNYTRFFVLGLNEPPRTDPSKTSVIFTTRHQPGALYQVLSELAERNINLTKIESRPRRSRPWHYLFYVDFEGHEDQREVREALLGILKQASFLKVLGSYPAASLPVSE